MKTLFHDFDELQSDTQKVIAFCLVLGVFTFAFVANGLFTFLREVATVRPMQQVASTQLITEPKYEAHKPKSYWSLTLRFEEGGSDD